MNSEIEDVAEKVIDWYWQHGSKRKGAYALGRGGWLDSVNRIIAKNKAIKSSLEEYAKPTMALWGPSQTGKSTLLAEFIDHGVDEAGTGSALSWDGSPARFTGDLKKCKTVLNPFNNESDGSGCVTRFQLVEQVRFPEYPIEIRFATEMEVLLSLAEGYLSEMETKNRDGDTVQFGPDSLEECVRKVTQKMSEQCTMEDPHPDPKAYSLLTELLDVVEVLVDKEEPRYANLKKEWKSRRVSILNEDVLASNENAVIEFAAELLWDGWENMTGLYKNLRERRRQLEERFHHKTVFCSIEVAAILLDISSASHYHNPDNDSVRETVDSCRVKELRDSAGETAMVIYSSTTKEEGGEKFFKDDVEFALIQSLVSLMVVKLRDGVMKKGNKEVYDFLKFADIVDFPGVANEFKSANLLTDQKIALEYKEDGKHPLYGLVQVMKRGKTSSIVISSSRNLNIDVFALLLRYNKYPGHPEQLLDGIKSWFKSMGVELKSGKLPAGSGLPVNLIFTFSARLINDYASLGRGGLTEVFRKYNVGELLDPKIVTPFCVTYPQFKDGRIDEQYMDTREEIICKIGNDTAFTRIFGNNNLETVKRMSGLGEEESLGGRLFLFSSVLEQLRKSKRKEMLEQQKLKLQQEWQECMNEALPGNDLVAKRRDDIEILVKALKGKTSDEVQPTAQDILKFQNIDPSQLNSFPRKRKALDGKFLNSQISQWIEAAKREPLQTRIGFVNTEHRSRILTYLRSRVDQESESITELFDDIAVLLESRSGRSECRRLFATFMTSMLYPQHLQHRAVKDSVALLEGMVKEGTSSDVSKLPYYVAVIAPFIETLEELENKGADQRGEQEGDKELQEIVG